MEKIQFLDRKKFISIVAPIKNLIELDLFQVLFQCINFIFRLTQKNHSLAMYPWTLDF